MINELSDQTVEGGTAVEFTCGAVSSDYQPEIVWTFDSDIHTDCQEGSSFCVESEEFAVARLTRSKFVIETKKETAIHLITCYVKQEQSVTDRATLTLRTGIYYYSVRLAIRHLVFL